MTVVTIEGEHLAASIDSFGAQLRSLRYHGVEYLWNAGEAWGYSSPVLFPIISALPGDTLQHEGTSYTIPSHGFARRSEWSPAGLGTFELTANDVTRAQYPFEFHLTAQYTVETQLGVTYTVANRGDGPMPFLLGGHPAFRWPLPGATPNAAHEVRWTSGGDSMRQAVHGLRPGRIDSPAVDGRLVLDRAQFAEDAMLFDDIEPRAVTYTASGAARITLEYADYPRLGIWSKPVEGDFVCLEPWSGYPATADFEGDLLDLPEATVLAPGESRQYRYSVTIEEN